MRIVIDVRSLMDRRKSGIPVYTETVIRALLAIDRNNEYVLWYNSFRDIRAYLPVFDAPNVRYESTGYPNKYYNYVLQRLFARPRAGEAEGADVFFAPHLNFLSPSPRSRNFLTIHDLSFLRHPEFFSTRKNLWHRALGVRQLIRGFDRVIAVSEHTKADVVRYGRVAPERVTVIPTAVGPDYRPEAAAGGAGSLVRARYRLPARYLLYVGTFEPRKNIPGLIAAFERYAASPNCDPRTVLVLVGGDGWKAGPIRKRILTSPFARRIRRLGYVPAADKPALYALADAFLYPSFYEGFGLPPLEAMASGVPVIAANATSLPEVVGAAGILVDPLNPAEMADALIRLDREPAIRAKLREAGVRQAQKFALEPMARAYLKVFSEIRPSIASKTGLYYNRTVDVDR